MLKILDGDGAVKYLAAHGDGSTDNPFITSDMDITTTHIHEGTCFLCSIATTIAHNGTYTTLFKTGSKNNKLVSLHVMMTATPASIHLHENSLVSANGTAALVINKNRISNISSSSLVHGSPTVTSKEGLLAAYMVTGTKDMGGSLILNRQSDMFILKSNTNYILQVSNLSGAATSAVINIGWLEE